jgi:hypothetical protein
MLTISNLIATVLLIVFLFYTTIAYRSMFSAMTIPSDNATAVREDDRKLASFTSTSKDGRWRTFHKHAGLMQFIPSR